MPKVLLVQVVIMTGFAVTPLHRVHNAHITFVSTDN